jgi:hypothetical protein
MDSMKQKIAALLALAGNEGATEAEASLAAERAQEMMLKYGISLAEITMNDTAAKRIGADTIRFPVESGEWRIYLADGVVKSVGGQMVIHSGCWDPETNKTRKEFTFICPEGTVDSCLDLYRWMEAQLALVSSEEMRNRKETWVHGRSWRRSWLVGASTRICSRLQEKYRQAQEETETSTALVLMRDAVKDKMAELFPSLSTHRYNQSRLNGEAYRHGSSAGEQFDIGGGKVSSGRRKTITA